MMQLWLEFSKESRTNWFNSLVLFALSSLWLIYYLGIQGNTITELPEIIMILLFFFACFHFFTELFRQIKVFKKSSYRLLPISEWRLYLYNLLFSWVTNSALLLLYYLIYALISLFLNNTEQAGLILEYGKYLILISYCLLSLSNFYQFFYFLSFMFSLKVAVPLQRMTRYLLILLFILIEGIASTYLMRHLKQITFFQTKHWTITLTYIKIYFSDFILEGCLLAISAVITVAILKKYIEPEK
ncbi:hypothetical protein GIX45_05220 [Erwinia sp. CPCC 100877]|nr:hypothetical protein [Erwinia sp. CPCC 100877]